MTADGATVVVVGAGYEGKRRCYERLAALERHRVRPSNRPTG